MKQMSEVVVGLQADEALAGVNDPRDLRKFGRVCGTPPIGILKHPQRSPRVMIIG